MFSKDKHKNSQDSRTSDPEYAVYVYRTPLQSKAAIRPSSAKLYEEWERKITTRSRRRAFVKAKRLFASNDFHRVEIKRKIILGEEAGARDSTIKLYQKKSIFYVLDRFVNEPIGLFVGLCMLACILYYGLAHLS